MADFTHFSETVNRNIAHMHKHKHVYRLYRANIGREELWALYLNSFPPGANEVYLTNRFHDCRCCEHFIRDVGALITLEDNVVHTIWDGVREKPYKTVACALKEAIINAGIKSTFYPSQAQYGAKQTLAFKEDSDALPKRWNHFYCTLPLDIAPRSIARQVGADNDRVSSIRRSFEEITSDAVSTVLGLIQGNQLYRGSQYKVNLQRFQKHQQEYLATDGADAKEIFVWRLVGEPPLAIRSTVIGTLLQDLSADVAVESAVRSFEVKVAPHNYQRASAPISKGMVQKAVEKIRELGLEDSLTRRHAVAEDVDVNDVLFVSRSVKPLMQGLSALEADLFNSAVSKPKEIKNKQPVSIDEFMAHVLPQAHKLEVLFENKLTPNLMSLVAPATPSPTMFAWGNGFSWAYSGDATDSIKERVVKAGGAVDGVLRISLAWYNRDDLDLHVQYENGAHTCFSNKRPGGRGSKYAQLDVDMNAGSITPNPVENMTWDALRSGKQSVWVHNYNKRPGGGVGFAIQMAYPGFSQIWHYAQVVKDQQKVPVMSFVSDGKTVTDVQLEQGFSGGDMSKEVWGIKTLDFHEVEMVTLSPNFWNGQQLGNKHWFFILAGCLNPDKVRGVYNEFLRPELKEHRKVFEVLGTKTMCPPSSNQLSGLGFSSTITNSVITRVHHANSIRTYEVSFNV